jgi:uncharacterized membrane protein YsdA (DUF1294 family)
MQTFLALNQSTQLLIIYLVLVNVITFFYFGFDKLKAHWQSRRVPEMTLWILSLIGGSIGGLLGMKFFRHKTKKTSFQAGMAVIITVQILILYYILQ